MSSRTLLALLQGLAEAAGATGGMASDLAPKAPKLTPLGEAIKGHQLDELQALLRDQPGLANASIFVVASGEANCKTSETSESGDEQKKKKKQPQQTVDALGPLAWAIECGASPLMVEALLEAKANVDGLVTNPSGPEQPPLGPRSLSAVPLVLCMARSQYRLFERLLQLGASLEPAGCVDNNNVGAPATLLGYAIHRNELAYLKAALRARPEQMAACRLGPQRRPLLVEAAAENERDVLVLLVESKQTINAADANGDTAVHWAASHGHVLALEYLLASGARADLADKAGRLPIDLAIDHKHTDCIRILRKGFAKGEVAVPF